MSTQRRTEHVRRYTARPGERAAYIGRANGARPASPLANPYHIGKDGTRDEVIWSYRGWLSDQLQHEWDARQTQPDSASPVSDELKRLQSVDVLLCYCAPEACHGDVLIEVIEEGRTA